MLVVIIKNFHLTIKVLFINIFSELINISLKLCENYLLKKAKTQKYFFLRSFTGYLNHFLEICFWNCWSLEILTLIIMFNTNINFMQFLLCSSILNLLVILHCCAFSRVLEAFSCFYWIQRFDNLFQRTILDSIEFNFCLLDPFLIDFHL